MIVGDREYRIYLASLSIQEASFIRKYFDTYTRYVARELLIFPREVETEVEFEAPNALKVKWHSDSILARDLEGAQAVECWSLNRAIVYKGSLWLDVHLSAECALCDTEGCELCLDDEALEQRQGELM